MKTKSDTIKTKSDTINDWYIIPEWDIDLPDWDIEIVDWNIVSDWDIESSQSDTIKTTIIQRKQLPKVDKSRLTNKPKT